MFCCFSVYRAVLKGNQGAGRTLRVKGRTASCKPSIAHNLMLGASVITNRARNNKFAMHNVRIIAACKTPSHTQSTVFNGLDEVNRSIAMHVLHFR